MSFLAGRLASMEGAYFMQESKQAVSRLAEKVKTKLPSAPSDAIPNEACADVLPEVLKHSLPPKIFQSSSIPDSSTFSSSSKWALRTDPTSSKFASSDALNPLRGYVSLPQVTFGPKRWELPKSQSGGLASTANERRNDIYAPVSPEKLKAAAAGLSQIGKAFFAATVLVFGGSIVAFELAVSKLELRDVSLKNWEPSLNVPVITKQMAILIYCLGTRQALNLAHWIHHDIVEFPLDMDNRSLPHPCLITTLLKQQGISIRELQQAKDWIPASNTLRRPGAVNDRSAMESSSSS